MLRTHIRIFLIATILIACTAEAFFFAFRPERPEVVASAAGDWKTVELGAGSCDSVVDNNGSLEITATGIDGDNACFIYQEVNTTDVQLTARIFSTGGAVTPNNSGSVAVKIRDSVSTGSTFCRLRWRLTGQNVGAYRELLDGPDSGGLFGDPDYTLPVYNGVTFDSSAQECAFFESDVAAPDPTLDYIQVPQPPGSTFTINASKPYQIGFLAQSGDPSLSADFVVDDINFGGTITLVDNGVQPVNRTLDWLGDFETGAIQSKTSTHDGFAIKTLPEPQNNCAGEPALTSGCCGPGSALDSYVTTGETPPTTGDGAPTEGEVKPRLGTYFFRTEIESTKDYEQVNGSTCEDPALDKARTGHRIGDATTHVYDFDVEIWYGMSIYIPTNSECETEWTGDKGTTKFLAVSSKGASWTQWMGPRLMCDSSTDTFQSWHFKYSVNDGATTECCQTHILPGSAEGDYGKWTDWVIRYRSNPFSAGEGYPCPVNPVTDLGINDAKNQLYPCDAGIFEIWKSTGAENAPDGNGCVSRDFVQVFSLVNQPVGTVPHETAKLRYLPRIYKGNWKKKPTGIAGPIWFGFDEHYLGAASTGTTFEDVNPCGLSEPV